MHTHTDIYIYIYIYCEYHNHVYLHNQPSFLQGSFAPFVRLFSSMDQSFPKTMCHPQTPRLRDFSPKGGRVGSVFAIAIIKSGTFILQWDCISLVVGHHLPFERPLASWVKYLLLVANRVVILVLIAGTLSVLHW